LPPGELRWEVAVGEFVKAGGIVARWEDEKATAEIEARVDGIVLAILVPNGCTARRDEPIALFKDISSERPIRRQHSTMICYRFAFPNAGITLSCKRSE
jgi:pyruvate/2-oxoglutarate dehydrogenase complex dihydrolipoamide acyltransferase (E2) component